MSEPIAPQEHPLPERPAFKESVLMGPEGLRAGWGLLLYIGFFAAVVSLLFALVHWFPHHAAYRTSGRHEQSLRALLLGDGVLFVGVLVSTSLMARIERRRFSDYGTGGRHRLARFAAGLGWGVLFLSLLVLVLKLAGLLVFDGRLLSTGSTLHYGAAWLAGFLLVGFFEEMMLRGYLQFTLARGLSSLYEALNVARHKAFGFWTAAFLLSLVFGLGHGSNPGESPIGLLSAGVAGLVFCLSLWRTGSLWWAIGFHTTWDWAQSFLYGVADSGSMVQFHLLATRPVGRPILSGGATGPEGSLFILPVMLTIAGVILWTLPGRPRS